MFRSVFTVTHHNNCGNTISVVRSLPAVLNRSFIEVFASTAPILDHVGVLGSFAVMIA